MNYVNHRSPRVMPPKPAVSAVSIPEGMTALEAMLADAKACKARVKWCTARPTGEYERYNHDKADQIREAIRSVGKRFTSREVGDQTSLDPRGVSAYFSVLERLGEIRRVKRADYIRAILWERTGKFGVKE